MPAPRPIVILGPTAGGKSALAVGVAEAIGRAAEVRRPLKRAAPGGTSGNAPAQVISADSMQIYRHMDAGTAKPTPDQRRRVPHHLIDIVEPTERFTVSDWLDRADDLIARLQRQGVTPIIVGGTNLYIKALLEGMFEGPPADQALRGQLQSLPPAELHERLQRVDPDAAQRIHPNDMKRLVRALEVFEATGRPISQWQTQWDASDEATKRQSDEGGMGDAAQGIRTPAVASSLRRFVASVDYRHSPMLLGLRWPTEVINRRINLRVKAMFFPQLVDADVAAQVTPRGESLVDETRRLDQAGLLGPQARQALGYKQVLEHLASRCTLDEAFEQTKIQTRRFAKQQRTWLKRFGGVHWLDAADRTPQQLLDAALGAVDAAAASVTADVLDGESGDGPVGG